MIGHPISGIAVFGHSVNVSAAKCVSQFAIDPHPRPLPEKGHIRITCTVIQKYEACRKGQHD